MPAFLPRFQFALSCVLFALSVMFPSLVTATDRSNVVPMLTDNHGTETLTCFDNQATQERLVDDSITMPQGGSLTLCDGAEEQVAQVEAVTLPAGYETKQFTLPEGFSSQLVAGPPLVDHPTMGCFDDTGRLFVCDGDGVNMSAAELEENLPNRIRMLEDTDGDGVFDRSTVFADKMTFPMGGAWHDGALYVASPPNIWRLEDTTGDGVADRRDILVDKFGFTGNAASIHGCFLHPSGRIYWCDGYHGHEFQDQDGNIVSKRKGSYIFNCWPDGSDVRIHCGGGMDNPVEVDFTDAGDVIGTVNILYTRPRIDCLVHWQYGGAYPHREAVLEELQVTGDLLEPIHKFGHVAISGTSRYRSGVMNHQWGGNFFATQFNLGKVVRVELERSGSTFACTEREFLSCGNRDFHPTDVIEDADGSLLVVDTGGWFYRGCPTSQIARPDIKGGIYRIRRNGMTTQVDPRGNRIDWNARTAAQLMQDLKDTRHAVQEKAIQECVRRGEVVVPLLVSIVRNGDIVARRNAIWTLTRLLGNQRTTVITAKSATSSHRSSGTTKVQTAADAAVASSARQTILTRQAQTTSSDNNNPQSTSGLSAVTVQAAQAAILSALSDRDAEIRQAACQALSVNPAPNSVDSLLQAAVDPAANVRREAFVALGRTRSTLAFNKLLEWNDHHSPNDANADREERHARLFALLELSQSTEKTTIGSNQPQLVKRVQNNAEELIVFDQLLQDGIDADSLITCLKVGSPDVMLATSRIIRLRAAKKQLSESSVLAFESAAAERVQEVLTAFSGSGDQSAIRALLQAFGQSSQVLNRIAGYLQQTSDQPQLQTAVLQLLTSVPIGTVPELNTILGSLLTADSPDVRKAAIDTVAHLKQGSLLPELSRLSSDNDQPAPVRLAALRAVVSVQGKLDDSLFQRIVELTLSGTPDEQSLGAQLLGSVSLTAPQLQIVVELLASAGPQQLNDLVPLFNRALSPELAVLFLDGLENARSLNSLPMIEVSEIVKRFPQELHPQANALLDRMKAAEQHKLLKLDSLVASLKTGDPVRGQAIFFSEKSKCATCHVVGNQGKRVGPDLTTIGANRAPKDLLESIVFPSASIVRQYESYTLVTTAGRTWSGLVIKDTSEEVTLQQSTGEPVTVPRSEIEELVQSTVSIMPKGLDEVLTPQQIVDVVAWLQTLRQAP